MSGKTGSTQVTVESGKLCPPQPKQERVILLWLLVIALLLCIDWVMVVVGVTPVLSGRMPDTDTYMRLLRVEVFLDSWADKGFWASWLDSTIWRMNAPYGDVLNWTRAFDVLILACAAPLHFFAGMGWRDALFWGGAVLPVLLHVGLGGALAWAFAPFFLRVALPLVFLVSAMQPVMLGYNLVGRPDHQTVLVICVAMMLGCLIREGLGYAPRLRYAIEGGMWAGLGLWVSTEFEFVLVIVVAVFALRWLAGGKDAPLRVLEGLALGLFAMTGVAVGLERGADWAQVRELDKVSLSQWMATAVNCGVWGFVVWLGRERGLFGRVAALVVFGLAGLFGLAFFCPEIFLGPAGQIDPWVMEYFFLKIKEMKPLLPIDGAALLWLGAPLLAVPLWGGMMAVQRARWCEAVLLLPLFVLVVAYTVFGFLHARFAQFAAPLGAVLLVMVVVRAGDLLRARGVVVASVAQAALLVGPLLLGLALVGAKDDAAADPASVDACVVSEVIADLRAVPDGIVLAGLNYGPEILYFTNHSVIAGPYHRNVQGLRDVADFFATGDRSIVQRRGVRYVLVCANDRGDFAARLRGGDVPAWLTEIPLETGEGGFRLFSVDGL